MEDFLWVSVVTFTAIPLAAVIHALSNYFITISILTFPLIFPPHHSSPKTYLPSAPAGQLRHLLV